MNLPASAPGATTLDGVAALPDWGVIRVAGEQASAFLQGQLTQDVALLPPGAACLAGWCNAQGRLLASFIVCKRSPQEFWLACRRDLLAATLKRLSMFVLRAKARLTDATGELAVYGLMGEPSLSPSAEAQEEGVKGFLAPLPAADGAPRALWIAPAHRPPPPGPALPLALWDWAAVRSGVASVSAAVAGAFVPQMLNYESVGGISFKKGCYPGQEVVARSQFRGAIKRRAFVGHVNGAAQAGQPVFSAAEPEQPAGLIAQAGAAPCGGTAVIVSLQLGVAQAGDLHAGSPDGPPLSGLHQPYALLDDV
jgi:folate-binding protein YgfZ